MSPEEFDADSVLEEVREKKRAYDDTWKVFRLYQSGMGLGKAICAVAGVRPIGDQVETELDDYMRDHFYRSKGD